MGTTLDSLRAQRTRFRFETLVIGRDDLGLVRKYPEVRFIETEKPLSAGANRNLGIREARGRFVLFTDADCRAAPDWVETLVGRMEEGYRMVGGAYEFPTDNFWVTGENMAILNTLSPETPAGEVEIRVGGGNMGLWKEALVQLGGFDETFKGGQDNDLAIKLLKAGYKIYFEPRALVAHLHPGGSFADLRKHAVTYGRAAVALIVRHPDYYGWERIRRFWRLRWLFLLWSPLKAIQQTVRVFAGNPAWRKHIRVWPAIWLFYFYRRVTMAEHLSQLHGLEKTPA